MAIKHILSWLDKDALKAILDAQKSGTNSADELKDYKEGPGQVLPSRRSETNPPRPTVYEPARPILPVPKQVDDTKSLDQKEDDKKEELFDHPYLGTFIVFLFCLWLGLFFYYITNAS